MSQWYEVYLDTTQMRCIKISQLYLQIAEERFIAAIKREYPNLSEGDEERLRQTYRNDYRSNKYATIREGITS